VPEVRYQEQSGAAVDGVAKYVGDADGRVAQQAMVALAAMVYKHPPNLVRTGHACDVTHSSIRSSLCRAPTSCVCCWSG
jgi:hypothetical protein